jgi:hypothetical protein
MATKVSKLPAKKELVLPSYTLAGKGVFYAVEDDVLHIQVDTRKNFGPSKSGKTQTVASTEGFVNLEGGLMFVVNVNKR